jgi:hypothetical protein
MKNPRQIKVRSRKFHRSSRPAEWQVGIASSQTPFSRTSTAWRFNRRRLPFATANAAIVQSTPVPRQVLRVTLADKKPADCARGALSKPSGAWLSTLPGGNVSGANGQHTNAHS